VGNQRIQRLCHMAVAQIPGRHFLEKHRAVRAARCTDAWAAA
jgi:hypothetical protein